MVYCHYPGACWNYITLYSRFYPDNRGMRLGVHFFSFMTKSNQPCSKYSSKCIKHFPYHPHVQRVPQDFERPLINGIFPRFIIEPLLSVGSAFIYLFIFHYISENTLQKLNKILIGSKNPHYGSFISFNRNFLFWI